MDGRYRRQRRDHESLLSRSVPNACLAVAAAERLAGPLESALRRRRLAPCPTCYPLIVLMGDSEHLHHTALAFVLRRGRHIHLHELERASEGGFVNHQTQSSPHLRADDKDRWPRFAVTSAPDVAITLGAGTCLGA